MPFPDSRSADVRLVGDATPLTEAEIRDLLPWVRVLSNAARERLQAELSLIQLAALKRQEQLTARQLQSFSAFDVSTANANRWMIRFTAAVALMTLVMMVIGLYPLLHEHSNSVAPQSGEATLQATAPQSPTTQKVEEVRVPITSLTGATKAYRGFTYSFDGKVWKRGQPAKRYNPQTKRMEPWSDDRYDPLNLFSKEDKAARHLSEVQIRQVASQFGVSYEEALEDAKAQGYQVPAVH